MKLETAFTMDTSSIKYGKGVTREIGYDMEEQGCRRVIVVTDPNLGRVNRSPSLWRLCTTGASTRCCTTNPA